MRGFVFLLLTTMVLTGCLTDKGPREEVALDPIAVRKFANEYKDPRSYLLSIYRKKDGRVGVTDGFRLHRGQNMPIPMEKGAAPFVPLVMAQSRSGVPQMALVDMAARECWTDVDAYMDFGMKTLGYQQSYPYAGLAQLGEAQAYMTLCEQLRLDQLFIENALFYTRLATGGMGPLARGIEDPEFDIVLGWDLLRRFEFVRFDFLNRYIRFAVTDAYELDEYQLLGTTDIYPVPNYGCVVTGKANGKSQLFVLDPAGDFELAWPGQAGELATAVTVGDFALGDLTVTAKTVDGQLPHIGGRLLAKYTITLCPQQKKVYFEKPVKITEE